MPDQRLFVAGFQYAFEVPAERTMIGRRAGRYLLIQTPIEPRHRQFAAQLAPPSCSRTKQLAGEVRLPPPQISRNSFALTLLELQRTVAMSGCQGALAFAAATQTVPNQNSFQSPPPGLPRLAKRLLRVNKQNEQTHHHIFRSAWPDAH